MAEDGRKREAKAALERVAASRSIEELQSALERALAVVRRGSA